MCLACVRTPRLDFCSCQSIKPPKVICSPQRGWKGKKRKNKENKEGLEEGEGEPKMSKTELLNPIAKYYIIDSQFGYKHNVSLGQNCIQNLEKLFSRAKPAMLCPTLREEEGGIPFAPPSSRPSSLHAPIHPSVPGLHGEQR